MKTVTLLAAALFAQAGLTQEIVLKTIPEKIRPGLPFVVRLSGQFPTPCSLDGGLNTVIRNGEGSDALELTVSPSDVACAQVLTSLTRTFGHFEIAADYLQSRDSSLDVVLLDPDNATILSSATIEVVSDPVVSLPFRSGVYWDQSLPGNALALEIQGDTVFLGLLGYRADGDAQWLVELGGVRDGVVVGDLNLFAGGSCVSCGAFGIGSAFEGSSVPFAITFAGSTQAYLSFGDEPGRSMELVPFSPREIVSEGTIAGETFRMPDLSGHWVFLKLDEPESALVTELSVQLSGISDSGLAFFASGERDVQMQCSKRVESRFSCDLFQDEALVFSADSTEIAHDTIRTSTIVGMRID